MTLNFVKEQQERDLKISDGKKFTLGLMMMIKHE